MDRVLNIALDARYIAYSRGGIGRYTANLLREFALMDVPHRMFLYSTRPFALNFPIPAHWVVRSGSLRIPGASTLTSQTMFPFWAVRDKIDVFWSTAHTLPILLPPGMKKLLTVHDVGWKRFPRKMIPGGATESVLMPVSLRLSDHIIAVSEFTRAEVKNLFPFVRCPINVIYEASSLETMVPTDTSPQAKPYFLFVGSNVPRKNIQRMLEAYIVYRLAVENPIDIVLVSPYSWSTFDIAEFIRVHALGEYVHLVSGVDDAGLANLYAHARALVFVSLYEGFGLPLVEAMQWGIPSVASNNSAVAEIAGDAAILVDPTDVDAIAAAYAVMTKDEAQHRKQSKNARSRGLKFNWKQAAVETLEIMVSL